jgi:hypothetical protein
MCIGSLADRQREKPVDPSEDGNGNSTLNAKVMLGKRLLKRGEIEAALRAFGDTGMPLLAMILECGERLWQEQRIHEAFKAFSRAGAAKRLYQCGLHCLARDWIGYALEAFELAQQPPPLSELKACGDRLVDPGRIHEALLAYEALSRGKKPSSRLRLGTAFVRALALCVLKDEPYNGLPRFL